MTGQVKVFYHEISKLGLELGQESKPMTQCLVIYVYMYVYIRDFIQWNCFMSYLGHFREGDEDPEKAEKVSLTESTKPYESDDDPTDEYGGDFDVSKFNEEGSFIGAYREDRAREATV